MSLSLCSRRRRISFVRVRPEALRQVPEQPGRVRLPPAGPPLSARPAARLPAARRPGLAGRQLGVHGGGHDAPRAAPRRPPVAPRQPHVRHHRALQDAALFQVALAVRVADGAADEDAQAGRRGVSWGLYHFSFYF